MPFDFSPYYMVLKSEKNNLQKQLEKKNKEIESLKSGDALLKKDRTIAALEGRLDRKDKQIRNLKEKVKASQRAKQMYADNLHKCHDNVEKHRLHIREIKKENTRKEHEAEYWRNSYDKEHELRIEESERRKELVEENEKLKKENNAYRHAILKMSAAGSADSTNSGKTTATDSYKSQKKAKDLKKSHGNSRNRSGRKPGAQLGHPGHKRKQPEKEPQEIVLCEKPEEVQKNPEDWKLTGRQKSRTGLGIRLEVINTRYISQEWVNRKTGKKVYAPFPEDISNEINYEPSTKAFAALLNNYCHVSVRKTSEFLYAISDGQLDLSAGFINSLSGKFSVLSSEEQAEIYKNLLQHPYMNADTTYTKVSGTTNYVHISSNPTSVLFQASKTKGHKAIEGTPVEVYEGTLVHDGEFVYWKYGKEHQACLVHEERYLRRSIDNEPFMKWNTRMLEFLQLTIHEYKKDGMPDEKKLEEISETYDQILEEGLKEYKERIKESGTLVWNEGMNTVKRQQKRKGSILYFLEHPGIPWHNNAAEAMARVIKRKTRTSDQFRSYRSMSNYCDFMSVLLTRKKQGGNVYRECLRIFEKEKENRELQIKKDPKFPTFSRA